MVSISASQEQLLSKKLSTSMKYKHSAAAVKQTVESVLGTSVNVRRVNNSYVVTKNFGSLILVLFILLVIILASGRGFGYRYVRGGQTYRRSSSSTRS